MRLVKFIFLFSSLLIFNSCKKDPSNGVPVNPYNGKTKLVFNPSITYGTMTDQEGNIYKTVKIGNQTWMAENLRVTKFNDGSRIETTTGAYDYLTTTTPLYFSYSNTTNVDSIATYGLLYNWYAVNSGKLAPKGWRIPSLSDWEQLTDYLGGINEAGFKLKQAGKINWAYDNANATNSSGFTAIAGGYRDSRTGQGIGRYGYYWSTTADVNDPQRAQRIGFDYTMTQVEYFASRKGICFTIRCIKE